ncbi:myotubularin-related protein 2-like [Watersipora subatra]|uniref:myotubularin-related protein 2-like n=1 Tax=Watersipora subatra TaxID=2589382 RepID=UPI00355C83CA
MAHRNRESSPVSDSKTSAHSERYTSDSDDSDTSEAEEDFQYHRNPLPGEVDIPIGKESHAEVTYVCPYQGAVLGTLTLTNYRLYFKKTARETPLVLDVPLCVISRIEKYGGQTSKGENCYGFELFCKDIRSVRFALKQEEQTRRDLIDKIDAWAFPVSHDLPLFAFEHNSESFGKNNGWNIYTPMTEYQRLKVLTNTQWKLTTANGDYKLCPSYPSMLVVPSAATDEELHAVARFRSKGRLPVLTWINIKTQVSITRCSQPLVGIPPNKSPEDQKLVRQIMEAMPENPKLCIMDARPKVNAIANGARGGGYENSELYHNAKIIFLNIHNIHVMRESLRKLKEICHPTRNDKHWLSHVESTQWLLHIKAVLAGALSIVEKVDKHETSVLVHCSDGWDRTPQITALAMIMLDSYYRTIEGFEVLIEKEWISFGHKFDDRIGHGEDKHSDAERSPVFLQFIECVWQICAQFPTAFEFNEAMLIYILDHLYSCLYGTFLGNTERRRLNENLKTKTISLWTDINTRIEDFTNPLYVDMLHSHVLYPVVSLRIIRLWNGYYLRWNPKLKPKEPMSRKNRELITLRDSLKSVKAKSTEASTRCTRL